jgi:hypothetical protein
MVSNGGYNDMPEHIRNQNGFHATVRRLTQACSGTLTLDSGSAQGLIRYSYPRLRYDHPHLRLKQPLLTFRD